MNTRRLLAFSVGILASIALASCSDPNSVPAPGETVNVSEEAAAAMSDIEVETLPTDDIEEHIIDMPDGIHLQPGVDVFRIVDPALSLLIFDEENNEVLVPAPAVSAFDDIGERDLVYAGETAFIVKGKEMQGDMLVVKKGKVELVELIYGNFRIPFKVDMREWVEAKGWDYEVVTEEQEVLGEDGISTHRQQIQLIDTEWPKIKLTPSGPGELEIAEGNLRMNAEMDGVFEGRIGSFRSSYNCRHGGAAGGRFCIDRLGVWADTTLQTKGGIKATAEAAWEKSDIDDFGGPETIGRPIPLGATGISVNIEAFLERKIEGKVYGKVEAEATWDIDKSMPIGWVYTNNGGNGSGFDLLPNPEQVRTRTNENDFDASFAAGFEGVYELAAGLKFGLSDPTATAKLRGGDIGSAISTKLVYEPLKGGVALEGDEDCLTLEFRGFGRMRASIEFEADFRIWSWERNLTCPDDPGNCATLEKNYFSFKAGDGGDTCLELGYDALEISVVDPDEPLGYDDLPGFDIDMICKERRLAANPRAGRPDPTTRTKCITEDGLDSLSNTCPLDSGEVLGLTGTRRFDFGEKILPGDVIKVYQPRNQGCNGGGSATFKLVGGTLSDARTHEFFNGEAHEGSAELEF